MNIWNLSNICFVNIIQLWSLQIVQIIYKNNLIDDKYDKKYIYIHFFYQMQYIINSKLIIYNNII